MCFGRSKLRTGKTINSTFCGRKWPVWDPLFCGSPFCVLSQEMRHINSFLGAQNGGVRAGAKKSMWKKFMCFFCHPILGSRTRRRNFRDIPDLIPSKPIENKLSREGNELFDRHPSVWKTPTPPGSLQTQKVHLCALLSCLTEVYALFLSPDFGK